MVPAWVITFISGAVGAFVAAWAGAYLGFRRSKKERALDRRVGWHEVAIQSLAQYEERLERLRAHALNVLVVQGVDNRPADAAPPRPEDIPRLIKAPAILWTELAEAESRARAALRLGDLYTDGRTQLDCSVALTRSVNMVSGQWMDINPEPAIPWADLQVKAMAAATVRRSLQDSLRLVLELDGILATILGPKYRKRRALRQIERLRAELTERAS